MDTQDLLCGIDKKNPRHGRSSEAVPGILGTHEQCPAIALHVIGGSPVARNFHDFRLCRINFGMNETGVDA